MVTYFRGFKTDYGSYSRNVKLAIMANILIQIGMGIFMTLYNLYLKDLGYSEQTNGNVIALTALAQTLFLVPAGFLSDRKGRKNMMAVGAALSAVLMIGRSVMEWELLLLVFAFGSGIFMSFIQVSMIPWLAENSTEKERSKLFSFHFAVMMAASVIGNLAGGVLTDLFTLAGLQSTDSLRLTLLIGSGVYLAGLFPVILMKEERKHQIPKKQKETGDGNQRWKLVILFVGAQGIIGIGSGLVIPYLNLYFADRFDISFSAIGIILSLGQGATAVAMLIGPAIVSRMGEVKAVVLLQLLSLPFLLITGFTTNIYLAVFGFLFRQALMNAGNPIQTSLMMRKVPDHQKGIANSLSQMAFSFGWAAMGPVSAYVVAEYGSYWGYANVFSLTGIIYLAGAIYFYIVFKEEKTTVVQKRAAV